MPKQEHREFVRPAIKKKRNYGYEEFKLCQRISYYLDLEYPHVLFHFDFGTGTKLTIGQAVKQKTLNPHRGYPDLFILEPKRGFYGLFIEVKQDGEELFKKHYLCEYKSEHLQEQAEYMRKLRVKGYKAEFGVGYENCKKIIDEYLKL